MGINSDEVKLVAKWILGVVLLSGVVASGWWVWKSEKAGLIEFAVAGKKAPVPDREKYEVLVGELKRWREDLAGKYNNARSQTEKQVIEKDARLILELMMPEMMRCWLGTEYDFNGTAEKPGEGKIACGYFVSTVIRDAGFRVNRYKLAQQPSANILHTFIPREDCVLEMGTPYSKFADNVESMESGVYIVGMDTHVGFIVNRSDGMRFLHASGSRPRAVVEESRENAGVLRRSNWRMIGGLTRDTGSIRTWLTGEKFKVRD